MNRRHTIFKLSRQLFDHANSLINAKEGKLCGRSRDLWWPALLLGCVFVASAERMMGGWFGEDAKPQWALLVLVMW